MRREEGGKKGGISFEKIFTALKRAGTPQWGTRRMFEVQGALELEVVVGSLFLRQGHLDHWG